MYLQNMNMPIVWQSATSRCCTNGKPVWVLTFSSDPHAPTQTSRPVKTNKNKIPQKSSTYHIIKQLDYLVAYYLTYM